MIGTSSTLAGRMSKFSGVFILVLIVHHARTEATGAVYQKRKQKVSTSWMHLRKKGLPQGTQEVKDESTSRFTLLSLRVVAQAIELRKLSRVGVNRPYPDVSA